MTSPLPVVPAPSSWRLWSVWGIAVIAYVVSVANRSSLAAVGVDASLRFEVDASLLSMLAVIQLLVYGVMQIPVGLLLDRLGARSLIVVGMVVMTLGQLVLAITTDVSVAVLARVLLGAGDAAIFPSVLRLVAAWFPPRQAPVLVQVTGLVGQLGQLLSVFPLAALLHSVGWEPAFLSLAGLGAVLAVLGFVMVRDAPSHAEGGRSTASLAELRRGFLESWRHPATRLAFWSHFSSPFSGTAFSLLWGFPFLTAGNGLSLGEASFVLSVQVVSALLVGPVIGTLSSRMPLRRSYIVVPIIAAQVAVWAVVILWPGTVPMGMLLVLAFTLSLGGPASMIAFDHARTYNPQHRVSTASGIVNGGGFLAALLAILFIGIALDLQGAGSPDTYTLEAFKLAFATQAPLFLIGTFFLLRARRRTRVLLGLHPR